MGAGQGNRPLAHMLEQAARALRGKERRRDAGDVVLVPRGQQLDRCGRREGGYVPLEFDITDALTTLGGTRRGVLTLRVEDPMDNREQSVGKQWRWYNDDPTRDYFLADVGDNAKVEAIEKACAPFKTPAP